jgi:hypothetical protein
MESLKGFALHSARATRPTTPSLRSASPYPRPRRIPTYPLASARPRAMVRR